MSVVRWMDAVEKDMGFSLGPWVFLQCVRFTFLHFTFHVLHR